MTSPLESQWLELPQIPKPLRAVPAESPAHSRQHMEDCFLTVASYAGRILTQVAL